MFRNILMLTSAIAFAAPIALTQPASARPLSIQTEPVEWCWGCGGQSGGSGSGGQGDDVRLDLAFCVQAVIIDIDKDEREVGSCEVLSGEACEARCTPEAVAESCALDLAVDASPRSLAACGAERIDECRELCHSGGAGFCELRDGKDKGKGKGKGGGKGGGGKGGDNQGGDNQGGDNQGQDGDGDTNIIIFVQQDCQVLIER